MNEHTRGESEHTGGRSVLVRLRFTHNQYYVVVRNYIGPLKICVGLLTAINATLDKERPNSFREWDSIEILQSGGAI